MVQVLLVMVQDLLFIHHSIPVNLDCGPCRVFNYYNRVTHNQFIQQHGVGSAVVGVGSVGDGVRSTGDGCIDDEVGIGRR